MEKIIFVYNTKSDIINSMFDFAHKIVSPKTYPCGLCKLTHTNIGEKKLWKEFKEQSNVTMEFLHIDEFEELFHHKFQYPIILSFHEENLTPIVSPEEFSSINSVEDLIEKLKNLTLATQN